MLKNYKEVCTGTGGEIKDQARSQASFVRKNLKN
jgi:hypothetical protein